MFFPLSLLKVILNRTDFHSMILLNMNFDISTGLIIYTWPNFWILIMYWFYWRMKLFDLAFSRSQGSTPKKDLSLRLNKVPTSTLTNAGLPTAILGSSWYNATVCYDVIFSCLLTLPTTPPQKKRNGNTKFNLFLGWYMTINQSIMMLTESLEWQSLYIIA